MRENPLHYLVGFPDQLADVHSGVGGPVAVAKRRLLHRGRQGAVLIGHAVEESDGEAKKKKKTSEHPTTMFHKNEFSRIWIMRNMNSLTSLINASIK